MANRTRGQHVPVLDARARTNQRKYILVTHQYLQIEAVSWHDSAGNFKG